MKIIILFFFVLIFSQSVQSQTVVVNPDGTHSVGISHGAHTVVVNPDGTHSVGINHGAHTVVVNPDGTHSVGVNHTGHLGANDFTNFLTGNLFEEDEEYAAADSLFIKESTMVSDELYKLRVLRALYLIRRKEYKELRIKTQKDETYFAQNKANQLFNLGSSYRLKEIDRATFKQKKMEIIGSD